MIRNLLNRADYVIAQSTDTARNAQRYYAPESPAGIIPLGIEPSDVAPVARSELGLPQDRFVLITVGRLVARKRVDNLIRAIADRANPNDLLVVIGSGPKKTELVSLAESLGLGHQVRFEGRVTEERKQQLLSAADVFVSASEHEGFGLVFLEAMDRGLPVVAYGHGGQTDFLRDGVTGGLAPLGNQADFIRAISKLYDDSAYRERCAMYNKTSVKQYYMERCAAEYEQLFEAAIREQGSPASA
jgi:glycosyltransferase involved in cell wall biosynthesis